MLFRSTSDVFRQMRDADHYHGRCGYCEFRRVCGGCRARAYAMSGDYLGEEPFCTHQPQQNSGERDADRPDGLEELDGKILSTIQTRFPVAARPFDVLAKELGIRGDEVLRRVARLRGDGVIRRLGAVFDSRRLGYRSTLVAARIPHKMLPGVVQIINRLAGVTHNYRRNHAYNLWFTLTAESEEVVEGIIEDVRQRTGIADFHSLPALAVYKIRAVFGNDEPLCTPVAAGTRGQGDQEVSLDHAQKQLVRLLQEDLPLEPEPFAKLAGQLGWPSERVIEQVKEWLAAGVIRRFGAVVAHRRMGFLANGMAVFRVADDVVDKVGRRLAEHREVSHCYRRPPLDDFPYNLFAMIHGRSEEEVRAVVDRIAREMNATNIDVLFSAEEYKKTSMRYFVASASP